MKALGTGVNVADDVEACMTAIQPTMCTSEYENYRSFAIEIHALIFMNLVRRASNGTQRQCVCRVDGAPCRVNPMINVRLVSANLFRARKM